MNRDSQASFLFQSSPNPVDSPYRGYWYWFVIGAITVCMNLVLYVLYRLFASYLKWKIAVKTVHRVFQELTALAAFTVLCILGGDYFTMFDCHPQRITLEYMLPLLISLFFAGFCCEFQSFRIRIVDMRNWNGWTWVTFSVISAIVLFLVAVTFLFCDHKLYFFVGVIPCLLYFFIGYILSLCPLHPRLRFHPRTYQLLFTLCLLRKDNSFYSRFFAGLCMGAFVRSVAANPLQSLLEEETPAQEEVPRVQSRSTLSSALLEAPVETAVAVPPLGEVPLDKSVGGEAEENQILETIEKFNRGEIETGLAGTDYLEEERKVVCERQASDCADWNEKQKKNLVGNFQ